MKGMMTSLCEKVKKNEDFERKEYSITLCIHV